MTRNVLVVSSTADEQAALKAALPENYELLCAANQDEAIALLRSISVAVILLYKTDSCDALHLIRSNSAWNAIPVFVITDDATAQQSSYACGANACAVKAAAPELLKNALQLSRAMLPDVSAVLPLQYLIDNVACGVSAVQFGEDGSVQWAFTNNRFYEMLGYSKLDAQAKELHVLTMIEPDDRKIALPLLRGIRTDRKPVSVQFRSRKKDGSPIYIHCDCSITSIAGVGDDVIVSVLTDVTQRALLSITQRQTADRLRALAENSLDGIAVTVMRDDKPENLLTNELYYRQMGYTRVEFEAAYPDRYLAVYPPDREKAVALFRQAFVDQKPYENEYRIIHRDGSLRNIFCRVDVLQMEGIDGPVQLAFTRDVTALRKAELETRLLTAQLRGITSNLGCGITATSVNGTAHELLFASENFYTLVGCTKKAFAKRKGNFFSIVCEQDRDRVTRQVYAQLSSGSSATVEYRVLRPDGSHIWLRTILTRTQYQDTKQTVELATYSEITAQKELEDQLLFLNKAARNLFAQPDTEEAIRESLTQIMNFFGGKRAYLYTYCDERRLSANTFEVCADGVSPEISTILADTISLFRNLFQTQSCLYINTAELGDGYERERAILQANGIHALITAPVMRNGTIIGVIGVNEPVRKTAHLEALATLGDYMSVVLGRRDLMRRLDADAQAVTAIMDGIPGGFMRLQKNKDDTWFPLYFSEGYLKLTGLSREVLKTLCANDVFSCVHPADLPALRAEITKMFDGEELKNFRFRLVGAGGYLPVSVFGKMRRSEADEWYLNLYFSDAQSEQKAKDEQISLLDNLPCGAAMYDYDGKNLRIVHINEYYWHLVNRTPTQYVGTSFISAVYPDDRHIIHEELNACIREKRGFSADVRILYGKESFRPFRLLGRVLTNKDGTYRIFISVTPITDEFVSGQTMRSTALRTLLDASADYIFVKDASMHYLGCSKSFARLAGKSGSAEIIGKSDYELFDKKAADSFVLTDERVLTQGHILVDFDELLLFTNNQRYWCSTSKYPLRDARGSIIGLLGISRDITEKRQAQFEIEALLNAVPAGIIKYAADGNGEFAYISHKFTESLGYTQPQFREKFNNRYADMIWPDDRAAQSEKGINSFRIVTADGALKWFRSESARITDETGNAWIYATLTDITQQKQAEQQLRASEEEYRLAILQSDTSICRYYTADRTLQLSPITAKKYNLPELARNVPYSTVRNNLVSKDTEAAYMAFFDGILSGRKEGTAQYQRKLGGRMRWLQAQHSTIFSADGKPVSAVISFRDITQQKEHEAMSRLTEEALGSEKNPVQFILFAGKSGTTISYRRGKTAPSFLPASIGSLNELTDLLCSNKLLPEDRNNIKNLIAAGLATIDDSDSDDGCDYCVHNSERGTQWLNLHYNNVPDVHYGQNAVCFILRNITAQKRLEQSVIQSAPSAERQEQKRPHVYVRAFGYFDVFINEIPLRFSGRQEKELLAILIDRRGGTVTSQEAAALLWEDKLYDENAQANFRKIAMRLKNTLDRAGIGFILLNKRGVRSIDVSALTCDYYEYLNGNPEFIKVFRGAYMANYTWGEETLAGLLNEAGQA